MAVMLRARRLGKTCVVAGHKVGCKGIGVGHVADSAKPQLLDQAILQSEVRTLHTTFGLAAVGANALDVQLVHRSAELGIAVAALRRLVVTAEHAGFVAVEGQRLSMPLQVGAGGGEVAEGRFGFGEMQVHQLAGCIINEDQQRAGRSTILEPAMIAAIDLDQFAATGTPVAWLIDLGRPLLARYPHAGINHDPSYRFFGQLKAVALDQFFLGQSWTKVAIVPSNQANGAILQTW